MSKEVKPGIMQWLIQSLTVLVLLAVIVLAMVGTVYIVDKTLNLRIEATNESIEEVQVDYNEELIDTVMNLSEQLNALQTTGTQEINVIIPDDPEYVHEQEDICRDEVDEDEYCVNVKDVLMDGQDEECDEDRYAHCWRDSYDKYWRVCLERDCYLEEGDY